MDVGRWSVRAVLLAAAFFVAGCARPERVEARPAMKDAQDRRWLGRVFRAACEKGMPADGLLLVVSFSKQEMKVVDGERVLKTYRVSTSRYGVGNREGSNRTPRGLHKVAERFGAGEPAGRVFVARGATRLVIPRAEWRSDSSADRVMSRILWLDGIEQGVNRGEGIGSHERFIYIHGTNQEHLLGKPASHGCLRMGNDDVIELFGLTESRNTWCWISPNVPVDG